MLLRYLRADLKKIRRLPVGAAHVAIPTSAAAVFLIYDAYAPWEAQLKAEAYYQVLAMGFPFLIGIFSALLAEQELAAGAFWNMLSAERRVSALFSKLLTLLLLGAGAVLLASALFGAGFYFLLGERAAGAGCYAALALLLFGGNLFLYVLHFILAFIANKGVTVGVGIAESLLSALLLTGMGDGIWPFVPAAWASRFVTLLLRKCCSCAMIGTEWRIALLVCVTATAAGFLAFYLWACRWDGSGGSE